MTIERREVGGNATKIALTACPYCGMEFKTTGRSGGEAPAHIRTCDAVPSTEAVVEAIHGA